MINFAVFSANGIPLLSQIKIVLVETTHPGNFGAAARAMKNMGLSNLCLVNPQHFPNADATSRAAGADDILGRAQIVTSLNEAVADCQLIVGCSARSRTISWPEISPRTCAEHCLNQAPNAVTALLFGRENSGLKNHEMDLCHYLLRIPCNENFSSLNVSAAVQIICYELFMAHNSADQSQHKLDKLANTLPLATGEQMDLFFNHLHQTLIDIGFMHPDKSKSIMRRMRRIYNRTQLDTKELDILRGILRMSQDNQKSN